MPTTTKQSVLVYALNVLLLFNLTVIVVMLTDSPEPAHERANVLQRPASDGQDQPAVLLSQPGPIDEPAVASPSAEPLPLTQLSAEPFVLASPSAEDNEAAPSPTAQPETNTDPPVTFFGVGLE